MGVAARAVAEARGRSERHAIALAAPSFLAASDDPLRSEQVLANLLDNAIRYSPGGGPIEVALSRPAPEWVELTVRDRGVGIPPEARGRIFERFYQAHANGTGGSQGGLGLGLYICRQIAELHGGAIRAEFPPDGGTRVVVRLPRGREESDAPRVAD